MPNAIGRSNSPECSPEVSSAESTPASAAAPSPSASSGQPQGNSVTSWPGGAGVGPTYADGPVCDAKSVAELQAQAAKEAQARQAMSQVMDELGGAIDRFANDSAGPSHLAVATAMVRSRTFQRAAAMMPRDEFREAVAERIHEANPQLSEGEVKELTASVLRDGDDFLRTEASQRMKDKVVSMMRGAAEQFRATAKDPEQVEKLARALHQLESSARPEAKEAAGRLRAQLGLPEDGGPVTTEQLVEALNAQAKLMEHEAFAMKGKEGSVLYRALLTQDVGALLLRDMKAAPGSWAAEQVAAVRKWGEADEAQLTAAKFATTLALTVASCGMASAIGGSALVAGAGNALASAALSAPEVMVAFHEVDAASAGASAGTASADAGQVARHNARVAFGEALVATALSGAMAANGAAHAADAMASGPVGHVVKEALIDGITHGALMYDAHVVGGEVGPATGQSAIDQANALGGD